MSYPASIAPLPQKPAKTKSPVRPRPAFTRNPGSCATCPKRQARNRRRHAHHILPQRYLREYVDSLRLPEAEARSLLRRLISDTRNRLWLCVGPMSCHAQYEGAMLVIPRSVIPASAFEFTAELGDRWVARLEALYPELHPSDDSHRVPPRNPQPNRGGDNG